MRYAILTAIAIFLLLIAMCGPAEAQDVSITREAAIKAVENAERVTALEKENDILKQAFADIKDQINKVMVDLARVSGENTILKQTAVKDAAMIELLVKSVKKKCLPLTICL